MAATSPNTPTVTPLGLRRAPNLTQPRSATALATRRARQPDLLSQRGESEAAFQQAVLTLARHCGWLAFHPHNSQRSAPGYPDLTLCHPASGRVLFIELKTARGKLRPEQRTWLWALGKCPGVEVALWRPAQWDAIVAALVHGERLAPLALEKGITS